MPISSTPQEAGAKAFWQRIAELTEENLALKAEIERLRAAAAGEQGGEAEMVRDAHRFGYWSASGPANDVEAEWTREREEESWQEFSGGEQDDDDPADNDELRVDPGC